MSMGIQYLTNKNQKDWDEFINGHNRAGVWHSLEWKKILEDEYGYRPHYLLAEEGGEICGILPLFHVKSLITGNRLVSVPFSYDCGPIATSEEAFTLLINEAKKLTSDFNCDYLELKIQKELPETVIKNTQLIESKYYFTSVLKLSNDSGEIWKKLDTRRTRWAINKAKKSGVSIRGDTDKCDLKKFYDLKIKTRKKHGSPTHSLRFFNEIIHRFKSNNRVKLWVAEYDEKIISALIFYSFKDILTPAYIAIDEKYNSYMPNNLLHWQIIEWGCKNGFHYYDFGRTEPNNQDLLKFKIKWGCDNYKIPYYYYPVLPNLLSTNRNSLKARIIKKSLKSMPDSLLKVVNPLLIKHVG